MIVLCDSHERMGVTADVISAARGLDTHRSLLVFLLKISEQVGVIGGDPRLSNLVVVYTVLPIVTLLILKLLTWN